MKKKVNKMFHVPESLKTLTFLTKYYFSFCDCSWPKPQGIFCFAYVTYFFTHIWMICTSEHHNFHIQDCLHIFWSWWFWHCWFEKPDIFCWCYPKHQKCPCSSFSCLLCCPAESKPEDPQVTGPTSRQVVLQGMCLLPDINTGCDYKDFLPAARLSLAACFRSCNTLYHSVPWLWECSANQFT